MLRKKKLKSRAKTIPMQACGKKKGLQAALLNALQDLQYILQEKVESREGDTYYKHAFFFVRRIARRLFF